MGVKIIARLLYAYRKAYGKGARQMSLLQDMVAQCRKDREFLQSQVELMESGKLQLRSRTAGTDWVDKTPEIIESHKNEITQLDALVARHSEAE